MARLDRPRRAAQRPPRAHPRVARAAVTRAGGAIGRGFATIGRRCDSLPGLSRLFFAMSTVIDNLERSQLRRVPAFQAGDRVRVHFQVIEGTRRRTQVFEGVVLKRQGEGVRETFTVRKQSFGVGVERTFPLHSPKIERIEVAARGEVRRAKLYYLRDRVGKRARVRESRSFRTEETVERELLHAAEAEQEAAPEADVAPVVDETVEETAVDQAGSDEPTAEASTEDVSEPAPDTARE